MKASSWALVTPRLSRSVALRLYHCCQNPAAGLQYLHQVVVIPASCSAQHAAQLQLTGGAQPKPCVKCMLARLAI